MSEELYYYVDNLLGQLSYKIKIKQSGQIYRYTIHSLQHQAITQVG